MNDKPKKKTRPIPPELRDFVRDLVGELGPTHAAAELGAGRSLVISAAAGLELMPGSIALLREARRRRVA